MQGGRLQMIGQSTRLRGAAGPKKKSPDQEAMPLVRFSLPRGAQAGAGEVGSYGQGAKGEGLVRIGA